jgi:hypothetical protein
VRVCLRRDDGVAVGRHEKLFAAIAYVLIVVVAYGLTRVFSGARLTFISARSSARSWRRMSGCTSCRRRRR